jgi:hypothetical protein
VALLVLVWRSNVEYSQEAITRRLAHKVWSVFDKVEIPNDRDGNWRVAEGIVKRIIDKTYAADEWTNFLSVEDMRALLILREEADTSR